MNKRTTQKATNDAPAPTRTPVGVATARIEAAWRQHAANADARIQAARARLSHIEARSYGDVLVTTPRQGVSIEQLLPAKAEKRGKSR